MIDKLVITLVSPLGTALALLALAGVMALGARARRAATALAVLAFCWLWLWSMPIASDAIKGTLERGSGPRLVQQVEPADLIIVLGGALGVAQPPLRPYPDLASASDRLWHAARLYHAGKAPRVLLSGGSGEPGIPPEAPFMREFMLALGVPREAMLLESYSANTAENARFSRAVAGKAVRRVILVTSALHMRRARRAMERNGFEVVPAPTDFEVVQRPFDLLRVLPNASALDGSGRALKEWVALVASR